MVGTTRGKIAEGGPRPGFVEDATAPEGCHFTRLCPQTSSLPSLLSLNMVPLPCSWGLSTPLSGWKVGFPKTLVSTGLIQLSTDLTYGQIISDWRFRNLHHVLQPGTIMSPNHCPQSVLYVLHLPNTVFLLLTFLNSFRQSTLTCIQAIT